MGAINVADILTMQDLANGHLDIKSLGEAANGDENTTVVTRTGETYPSASKAIKTMFEAGGLPAVPFATKALMTASALVDGKYAMVTDDTVAANNGLYVKKAGVWVKSSYDPLTAAKEYTENYGKLAPTIINNANSQKIQGMAAYTSGAEVGIDVATPDKYVFVFPVKPNTEYTLYSKSNSPNQDIRLYNEKPASWTQKSIANSGASPTFVVVNTKGRYYRFVTSANTKFIAFDPRQYTDEAFYVYEGVYNAGYWDAPPPSNPVVFKRKVVMDELEVANIKTAMFDKSKNIAGLDFVTGLYHDPAYLLNTEYPAVRSYVSNTSITGKYMAVEPNTTYTLSKGQSDFFSISISPEGSTVGRIIFRDNGKSSHTFTTGANERRLFVHLSSKGIKPLVQLEKGTKATPYVSPLPHFDTNFIATNEVLGSTKKLVDNTYMDLGYQTDRFRYPVGNNPYTTATILSAYYEPLLAKYPQYVSKEVLGFDASGLHELTKYIFEPDHYEQTVFITSGMHPTEAVPPFALGRLLEIIYDTPDLHPALAYMRNCVRFIVIPVLNPWGMNAPTKTAPLNYTNVNGVNISRSFYNRWYRYKPGNAYDVKGTAPLTQAETLIMKGQLELYEDEITMVFDCHTGENWQKDAFVYWLDDDKYLKPALEQVVSIMNDKVRLEKGREPINETMESDRTLNIYFAGRTLGIPTATIEYGTKGTSSLDSVQMTEYVNNLFNYIHYALKARIDIQRKQDKWNEHNKPYVSLFNFLDGHNEYIDEFVGLSTLIANGMQSVGLVSSPLVVGVESTIVKLTHTPAKFDRTVVVMAGARGQSKKDVVSLAFTAYKFMTDDNPYIVALRKNTRIIFIPALNPVGVGNKSVNNASAVPPFANFSTSTQVEAKDLRAFLDAGGIDYIVQLDAFNGTNTKPHTDYALLQTISSNKYVSDFEGLVENLERKYNASIDIKSSAIGEVTNPVLSDYIATKSIPFTYIYLSQNILPKREPVGSGYVDYGYEANEMALCSEVIFNAIRDMAELLQQKKALALLGA